MRQPTESRIPSEEQPRIVTRSIHPACLAVTVDTRQRSAGARDPAPKLPKTCVTSQSDRPTEPATRKYAADPPAADSQTTFLPLSRPLKLIHNPEAATIGSDGQEIGHQTAPTMSSMETSVCLGRTGAIRTHHDLRYRSAHPTRRPARCLRSTRPPQRGPRYPAAPPRSYRPPPREHPAVHPGT